MELTIQCEFPLLPVIVYAAFASVGPKESMLVTSRAQMTIDVACSCPVSHTREELDRRFMNNENRVVYNGIVALSPGSCTFLDVADIIAFCRHYSAFCGDTLIAVESEIALLKDMFTREEEIPKTLLEFCVFISPHNILFPRIFTAIQIAATVPVSSSSAERSFSALKRIKSYLRSTMSEERGSDLGCFMLIAIYLPSSMKKTY